MDLAYDLLVFVHLLAMAGLVGGLLAQVRADTFEISALVLHSSLTLVVTGLALVGLAEAVLDKDVNHAKVGVKLVIALTIAVLCVVNRKREVPRGLYFGLLGLAVTNVAVATIW